MKQKKQIILPNNLRQIVLHCCCAPCSAGIIDYLLSQDIKPTIFFYNPNIYPEQEYEVRKQECMRYAKELGLNYFDANYNHEEWLKVTTGLETEPERGKRCLNCFKTRMLKTAEFAKQNNIEYFTTTLASSRWKSLDQIFAAGLSAEGMIENTKFLAQNWKICGLNGRRIEIIKEYNFYQQQYCGCEFSQRNM